MQSHPDERRSAAGLLLPGQLNTGERPGVVQGWTKAHTSAAILAAAVLFGSGVAVAGVGPETLKGVPVLPVPVFEETGLPAFSMPVGATALDASTPTGGAASTERHLNLRRWHLDLWQCYRNREFGGWLGQYVNDVHDVPALGGCCVPERADGRDHSGGLGGDVPDRGRRLPDQPGLGQHHDHGHFPDARQHLHIDDQGGRGGQPLPGGQHRARSGWQARPCDGEHSGG